MNTAAEILSRYFITLFTINPQNIHNSHFPYVQENSFETERRIPDG